MLSLEDISYKRQNHSYFRLQILKKFNQIHHEFINEFIQHIFSQSTKKRKKHNKFVIHGNIRMVFQQLILKKDLKKNFSILKEINEKIMQK